jgi:hypothetical protein
MFDKHKKRMVTCTEKIKIRWDFLFSRRKYMAHGFMGKILWVDLSKKQIKEEPLDEKMGRDFLGGYGLGARILFSRQKAGVDPMGPDAILGLVTGVLTGTDAMGGSPFDRRLGRC